MPVTFHKAVALLVRELREMLPDIPFRNEKKASGRTDFGLDHDTKSSRFGVKMSTMTLPSSRATAPCRTVFNAR